MIAVIRMTGQVNQKETILNTLNRLKLGNKFTCVFVDEKNEAMMGMVIALKDKVMYGEVDKKLMDLTIEKRGQKDIKGNYRGFCRLHPPIGGFKKTTKKAYPMGVLGKNKDIVKLLEKML